MKYAFMSDTHVSATRHEDNRKGLLWIAQDMAERQVDYLLHAGDWFDRTAREDDFRLTAEFFSQMNAETYMLAGNHGTWKALETVENMRTITGDSPTVIYQPGIIDIGEARIYAMPHLDKSNIQLTEPITGIKDSQNLFNESISAVMDWFAADSVNKHGPKIYLGHHSVTGAKVSTGQTLFDPGLSQGFGIHLRQITDIDLTLGVLGHYHMTQMLAKEPFPVFYVGSHTRQNHGEMEDKGYWIADINAIGELCSLEFIKNPYAPKLITETWSWKQDEGKWDFDGDGDDLDDAEVRVIACYFEGDKPDMTDLKHTYIKENCRFTIDARVTPVDKIRAIEVAQAKNPVDKLNAYWAFAGAPDEEHRLGIMAKLDTLILEVQGEAA